MKSYGDRVALSLQEIAAQLAASQSATQPVRDPREGKIMSKAWRGVIRCIQPQVRMTRSFDQRDQVFRGFVLEIEGQRGERENTTNFTVHIGDSTQEAQQFRVGDQVSGDGGGITLVQRGPDPRPSPPWQIAAPPLAVYQARGYRRLSAVTYKTACATCIWGVCANVEMIIDHWKPAKRESRTETFCFGPLSCRLYKPGPKRKVPGRRGLTYTEENWVDEQETSHRGPDE